MTAHVDLLIARQKWGTILYEPWWFFADYTDTSGLTKDDLRMRIKGKGVIIDALFGDGPDRYGFTSKRTVVLAKYDYGSDEVLVSEQEAVGKYIVETAAVTELFRQHREERGGSLEAFLLSDVVRLLQSIPAEDLDNCRENTVPMSGFLMALPPECLVIPHIGMNLAYEIKSVQKTCGNRSGILPARYLE
jgi:hypothetical protein